MKQLKKRLKKFFFSHSIYKIYWISTCIFLFIRSKSAFYPVDLIHLNNTLGENTKFKNHQKINVILNRTIFLRFKKKNFQVCH